MRAKEIKEPKLSTLFMPQSDQKIAALPLQFDHLPVEMLSKEFTKLNSPHPYRVHYLGPRSLHTLALHKRYGYNEELRADEQMDIHNRQYPAPLRRIFNSNYMNERLRDNHHYRSSFFYRAFEGMNPTIPSDQLFFNSAFESGNLDCAIKVGLFQYDIFLRIDSNSRGHTNWYYFSVKCGKNVGTPIKFNICNLKRKLGLYDQSFRPFVKSRKAFQMRGQDWSQKGEGVEIQAASMRYQLLGSKGTNFYRLKFQYTFEFEKDQVFFAYCIPYTYSDQHQDIRKWSKSQFIKSSILGRSLSGLQLPLLHIANHQTLGFKGYNKKNIVITGRVHPAESNGSYVLKGFIEWVLGQSKEAGELRERTNIFIIPMLNPDGVVMGNSRTSAAGKDLNRQFLSGRKDLYPEVYLTKTLIARLQKTYRVLLFLDFHGHSNRKNTFFYGPAYPISHRQYYRCRAFPKLIEKINPSFRFYSCSFQISQVKRSAARAVALSQLKVPYAYTVQSSVGLYYDPQAMKTLTFNKESWEEMGSNISLGLTQFVLGLQELQILSRERKGQREKLKEGKTKERQREREFEGGDKKQKKKFFLLDVIEEVKVAVSKGNFDDDIESDDHDSAEDLQPYKISEFNNLVIVGKQRQRKAERKQLEQQDQNFQMPQIQEDQPEEENPYQQIPKQLQQKMTRSVESRSSWSKIIHSSTRKERPKIIQELNRVASSSKIIQPIKNKDYIRANRQRYSSYNLKMLGGDRCQIISLPKTPFFRRQKPIQRQQHPTTEITTTKRSIRSIVETMQLKIEKRRSSLLDPSAYQSLEGFELDNRAMKITTFKRK